MNNKRCYLSGPMTGYENFNIPAFKKAKEELEKLGFSIVLPVDIETQREGWLWGDYLAEDIRLICNECEGIILLPEWAASRGAKLELSAALMQSLKYPDFKFYEYIPEHLQFGTSNVMRSELTEMTKEEMASYWYNYWDYYSKEAQVAA